MFRTTLVAIAVLPEVFADMTRALWDVFIAAHRAGAPREPVPVPVAVRD